MKYCSVCFFLQYLLLSACKTNTYCGSLKLFCAIVDFGIILDTF